MNWEQKYYYIRDQMQQEIPGFTIRAKDATWCTRLIWQIVGMIFHLLWGFNAPKMSQNHTTVMRTIWTGAEWDNLSYINRWMILTHERRYLLLLWEGKSRWFSTLRYIFHLFHMIISRSYRQSVMETCWQENINYHVQSNKGSLNHHARHRIIRTLSGPEFAFSFTKSEATDCINRMVQKAVQQYEEAKNDGRSIQD